jgi:cell division protein FtsQ
VKNKKPPNREEPEQYEAYGQYAYEYRPSAQSGQRDHAQPEDAASQQSPSWEQPPSEAISPSEARERVRARTRAATSRLILVLALLVIVMLIAQNTIFRLTTVYVVGYKNKTPQQIAAASGLVKGLNMFSISEDEVRENLASDHTIVFLGMQKEYPSTIRLYISEREEVASLQWLGLLYTLDKEGIVMTEANSTVLPSGIPTAVGLQVTSIHVGQKLAVRNQKQLDAYCAIIEELGLQYYQDQVLEINLSDTDNLFLQTAAGISVRLGNSDSMRAKIGAVRTDIPYLVQLGKTSGVLDVTTPEDAKYSPDN